VEGDTDLGAVAEAVVEDVGVADIIRDTIKVVTSRDTIREEDIIRADTIRDIVAAVVAAEEEAAETINNIVRHRNHRSNRDRVHREQKQALPFTPTTSTN